MAQQLISIGLAPNDGTGDKIRDAFAKVNANETELYQKHTSADAARTSIAGNLAQLRSEFNILEQEAVTLDPLYVATSKTVGAGQDYETLDLALAWINTMVLSSAASIELVLDDGDHTLAYDVTTNFPLYQYNQVNLSIRSASGDKALCSITIEAYDDLGAINPVIFAFGTSTDVTISNITLDAEIGAYAYANTLTWIQTYGKLTLNNTDGLNSKLIVEGDYATIDVVGGNYDGLARAAIDVKGGELALEGTITIANSLWGIFASGMAKGSILATMTWTNNTNDLNVTMNVLMGNGTLLTDGVGPITLAV